MADLGDNTGATLKISTGPEPCPVVVFKDEKTAVFQDEEMHRRELDSTEKIGAASRLKDDVALPQCLDGKNAAGEAVNDAPFPVFHLQQHEANEVEMLRGKVKGEICIHEVDNLPKCTMLPDPVDASREAVSNLQIPCNATRSAKTMSRQVAWHKVSTLLRLLRSTKTALHAASAKLTAKYNGTSKHSPGRAGPCHNNAK